MLALKKVRKKFTNHCARKTTLRKLKKAKIVSSEHIANVTGHRGINVLNDYDEIDEEKLRALAVAKCNNENPSSKKKQIFYFKILSDITTTVAPLTH